MLIEFPVEVNLVLQYNTHERFQEAACQVVEKMIPILAKAHGMPTDQAEFLLLREELGRGEPPTGMEYVRHDPHISEGIVTIGVTIKHGITHEVLYFEVQLVGAEEGGELV